MKQDVQDVVATNNQILVLHVEIGTDSNASQRVMSTVKDIAPDLAFMGVSDEDPSS